ncbi:MAG: S8 family serine peptidase [Nitriliruptoraceae bacterium]
MKTSGDLPSTSTTGSRSGAGRAGLLALVLALVPALLGVHLAVPAAGQVAPAASISVDPLFAPPGAVVAVSGADFDGCAVALSFVQVDASPVDLGQEPLTSDGTFETPITVPSEAVVDSATIVAEELVWVGDLCGEPSGVMARSDFRVTEPGAALEPRFEPDKPETTEVLEGFADDRIHVKFSQDTRVRLDDGRFVTLGDDELSALEDLLDAYPEVIPTRLFDVRSEQELDRERLLAERVSGREQGDKNLYFRLSFPSKPLVEVGRLIDELNALDLVELAYPESAEELDPANGTPDYRLFQGYRVGAPGGINAHAARTLPGGRGENVQIIDIERWFNPEHEDLPTFTVYTNGEPLTAFSPPFDHGTAVLGSLFGRDDGSGVLGLADLAAPAFVSRAGGTSNAIDVATANSVAGDVILLEVQLAGANGGCTSQSQFGCVAVEFEQANFDAIVTATSLGINVVQAAGNGSQDLDSAPYHATFGSRPDSGSIIVGAGAADPHAGVASGTGTPGDCTPTAPPRGRMDFSTFGTRVDLQGWGECVTTTGYGSLQGSADSDDAYTGRFSGTSSASPIVTAAVGIVSSVSQAQGTPLTPAEIRSLLVATGTPQDTSALALAGNIGPLPDLAAALGLGADLSVTKVADRDPVAAGTNLTYTVTVANLGPNTAPGVELVDALASELPLVTADPRCGPVVNGDVVCGLGDLAAGASTDVQLEVAVPADLVHLTGGPVTITNQASVSSSNDDPDPTNDTASVDTTVIAVADLEVYTVSISGLSTEALIGAEVNLTVTSVVRNRGPSSPMNAVVTTAAAGVGVSAIPVSVDTPVLALTVGADALVEHEVMVRCEAPGRHEVLFTVGMSPAEAVGSDPNPANDTGQVTATLDCVTPIAINIRPGNAFNLVNLGSRGVVPVAALSTAAGEYDLQHPFDATTILADTVRFGSLAEVWNGTGGAPLHNDVFHVRDSHELDDRTQDRDLDMVLYHRISQTGLEASDLEACLTGIYVAGGQMFTFLGCDAVTTVP